MVLTTDMHARFELSDLQQKDCGEYKVDYMGLSIMRMSADSADLVARRQAPHTAACSAFVSLIPISHNPLTLRDMAAPGLPV